MAISVERSDDAATVLEGAGGFLASRPVLHNLILSLLHARVSHPEPGRSWVAWEGSEVVGVAFQSPFDFPLLLTPMPDAALTAVVLALAEEDVAVGAITADAATAARFAGEWTERRCAGATPFNGGRIYELDDLRPPPPSPGHLRPVLEDEGEMAVKWMRAFEDETGERGMPAEEVKRRVTAGRLWFWDDGGPVALSGNAPPVQGIVRIGPVFTPGDLRRRGYGSSCVAALSRHFLGQGYRCTLFTDLANPVSNSIYRKMGYTAVGEILRYRFC